MSIPAPNYTQAPNAFFDDILPEITSLSELKVTLAIMRQTFGWHKAEDRISLSQLEELTGLSRESVADGIKRAMKRGTVGRRKVGQGYVYGLRVTSQESRPPEAATSQEFRPVTSQEFRPTKETGKESVEANASSGKPQTPSVVSMEKYVTDRLYEAMRESGYRLPSSDFGFHLGRAKDMLAKDSPTDEEVEALPEAFVRLWKIKGKADAQSALMELRRQKARAEIVNAEVAPAYEPVNPHGERGAKARNAARSQLWYASAYEEASWERIGDLLRRGFDHDEMCRELERGVSAGAA